MSASKQGKRLLIVEDDEALRAVLRKSLEGHDYQVIEACDGIDAKEKLAVDASFDAIVSDIRMPRMNGIDFTKFVKTTCKLPIILVTGFSDLLETYDAYALGADDFVAKPFKVEELIASLEKIAGGKGETAVGAVPAGDGASAAAERPPAEEFCKVSIDDFISGSEIPYDVFVRLSAFKHIKVAHKGENIDLERVKAYKARNVRFLYLRQRDFARYLGLNLKLLGAVGEKRKVEKSKKLNLLKHTGEIMLEHLHFDGVDEANFDRGRSFVESVVSIMSSEPELDELLTLLNEHSDVLYIHSVGVALYAHSVATRVGWSLPGTLCKVTMGGLLHDIGEKEIAREILLKPRRSRSLMEVKQYESHPQRGFDILRSIESVPVEVAQIVQQHHENCQGTGYPVGHLKEKIFPPARLVAVVDEFCNLILSRFEGKSLTPTEAFQRMDSLGTGIWDPAYMNALKAVFKYKAGA